MPAPFHKYGDSAHSKKQAIIPASITFFFKHEACILILHSGWNVKMRMYWVTSSITHARRLNLSMHRSNMVTQIHEERRGYIHGSSREYTLDGANTFTVMKHKLLRHPHEWRHNAYYNVVLRWLPSTSIYKMHEGVGGCEGPRVIYGADLPRAKLLILWR